MPGLAHRPGTAAPGQLNPSGSQPVTAAEPPERQLPDQAGSPGGLAATWEMCSTVGMVTARLMAAAFLGLIVASLVLRAWVLP